MTLSDARQEVVDQAGYDLDLYKGLTLDSEGKAVQDADGLNYLLSRACQLWAAQTYSNYDHNVALTLTASTKEYNLRSLSIVGTKILKPRVVVVNDSPLRRRDGREYGLWTLSEFERHYPTWRGASDDVPVLAVWQPTNELILHPTPAATYSGKNFISGWTLPGNLTAADDSSELPIPDETDHFFVVRLAIALGSMPMAGEQEGWQRFMAMDNSWAKEAERRKRANIAAHLGRRPRGQRADWLYA